MSTIKSSDEHLTLNADGSSKDIKFQANGVEKASISSTGVMTATSFAGSGAALTGVGVAGISSSADATAITINSSEQVGIGTGSPTSPLHVLASSAGQTVAKFESNQAGAVAVEIDADADRDSFLRFQEAGTNRWDFFAQGSSGTNELNIRNQSGTNLIQFKQDGRGLSQFTAKAWANWNGTGTPAFRDSHNCSSLTDVSTGNYRINFSNNMANTNYCPVANGNAENTWLGAGTHANGIEVAYVAVYHVENNNSTDTSINNVLVFGD